MSVLPPVPRPDGRTLTAFLADITGSESRSETGRHRTIGLTGPESDSPTASGMAVVHRNGIDTTGYRQSPTVRPESTRSTIETMVAEMAEDIDRAIALGGRLPFTGDQLRQHYVEQLAGHDVDAVLADAKRRWLAQVACNVLPLASNNLSGSAIRTDNRDAQYSQEARPW